MKRQPCTFVAFWGVLILAFSVYPLAFSSDVPDAINYQGKLTDGSGAPASNGYYEIQFRIWDDPAAVGQGNLIWGRTYELHVMDGGIFNILLGPGGGAITNPVSPAVTDIRQAFEGEDRYLGLTVTRNPTGTVAASEISPRQALVSAPFALHAQNATLAQQATMAVNASNANHAVYASGANAGFVVQGGLTVTSGMLRVQEGTYLNGAATLANSLNVAGATIISNTLRVAAPSALEGYGTVPLGGIIMWYGIPSSIPNGWALCDGTQGTPDLRDRFIVGAGNLYTNAAIGGEVSHQLTVQEMPSHTHGYTGKNENSAYHTTETGGYFWKHDAGWTTTSTGGDLPHENRPPYFALCYIMRVK